MADQATEMINSMSEADITAYMAGSGQDEPHIVIGRDRFITVPADLKRIAVQHDHNVETVTFDCPRYWDGIDMSTDEFAIYINYMLADNSLGSYVAENVSVDATDDSIMHFTWTISENVTKAKGSLMFLVCIKKVEDREVVVENVVEDEEGNEIIETETVIETVTTNHWNSELNKDLYVSEGLETVEAVSEMTPDFVTKVLTTIDKFDRTVTGQLASDVVKLEGTVLEHTTQISNLQKEVDENKTELQAEIDADVAAAASAIRAEMDQGDAALRVDVDANSANIGNLTGRMVVAEEIIGAIDGDNVLSVEKGGTGANNAAGALANLGVAAVDHAHATRNKYNGSGELIGTDPTVRISHRFIRYTHPCGCKVGLILHVIKDSLTNVFRIHGSLVFESAPISDSDNGYAFIPSGMLYGPADSGQTILGGGVTGISDVAGAFWSGVMPSVYLTADNYAYGCVAASEGSIVFARVYGASGDDYVYNGKWNLGNTEGSPGGMTLKNVYDEIIANASAAIPSDVYSKATDTIQSYIKADYTRLAKQIHFDFSGRFHTN